MFSVASPDSNSTGFEGSATDVSPNLGVEPESATADIGPSTSPSIGSASPWCLLVPLGATEQHGPHLPVATDTIIAHEWARAAARFIDGVVVAPPLPYGSSGEHQAFAGTISIGQDALNAVLVEIARSVRSDYQEVVFVSGHGGNVPVLQPVVEQLRFEGQSVEWVSPRWHSDDIDDPALLQLIDAHAGHSETSLMLYLRPELVRPFENVTGNSRPLADLMPILRSDGLAAVSESGVLGNPSAASRSHGETLFLALVMSLVRTLRQLRNSKMRS